MKEIPDNAVCSNPHTILRKGSNQAALMRIPVWVKHGGAEWDTSLKKPASQTIHSLSVSAFVYPCTGLNWSLFIFLLIKQLTYELIFILDSGLDASQRIDSDSMSQCNHI